MPFRSLKQRKFMYSKHPEIAKEWTKKYGSKVKKSPIGKRVTVKRVHVKK